MTRYALWPTLLGLILFTAACTSESPGEGAGATLDVALGEWHVQPAQESVAAGAVTFEAANDGPEDPHELVVLRTDLAVDALPVDANGAVVEGAEGVEEIGEIEGIAVGQSLSATFDLAPGRYLLICNLVEEEDGAMEAHFAEGMVSELTVR